MIISVIFLHFVIYFHLLIEVHVVEVLIIVGYKIRRVRVLIQKKRLIIRIIALAVGIDILVQRYVYVCIISLRSACWCLVIQVTGRGIFIFIEKLPNIRDFQVFEKLVLYVFFGEIIGIYAVVSSKFF